MRMKKVKGLEIIRLQEQDNGERDLQPLHNIKL